MGLVLGWGAKVPHAAGSSENKQGVGVGERNSKVLELGWVWETLRGVRGHSEVQSPVSLLTL